TPTIDRCRVIASSRMVSIFLEEASAWLDRHLQDVEALGVGLPASAGCLLVGGRVPDLHGPVLGGAGEVEAVRAEGHAIDWALVPLEGECFLTCLRVPDLHRLVIGGAGEAAAVRAERHAAASSPEGDVSPLELAAPVVPLEAAQILLA